MTIKSDRWIRRMALEEGMIEPFEDRQVRKGVISYGLSSYGYDMRVADEFRIFHNAIAQLVDPKAFDERSFIEVRGDSCIIPPNSFALARSVEYFRIPRNVMTICLGKCVAADTRVVDADTGAYLPICEFAGRGATLGMVDWELRPLPVADFVSQGKKPVLELTTRLGLRIRATPNHPFRRLDGWTALQDLRPGDRIAAARRVPVFGNSPLPAWEAALLGLMISEGQCHTPGRSPTFTSADPVLVALLEKCVRQGLGGKVTPKGNLGYRLVNREKRGSLMTGNRNRVTQWLEAHGLNVKAADKFVPQAVFTAPRDSVVGFLRALFSGDGSIYMSGESVFLEYYSMARRLVEGVHHLLLRFGILSLIRQKKTHLGTTSWRIQITDRDQVVRFAEEIGFWPSSIKQIHLETAVLPKLRLQGRRKSNFDALPKEAWALLGQAVARRKIGLRGVGIAGTNPSQSVSMRAARQVALATEDPELTPLVAEGPVWDTVEKIEPAGVEEVYDLTIPGAHNFVANNLIVHNSTYARCGIITNVTPFEPEWEGYVTLEISNTTPLPARIYANEGIAQVIFFESDEECEVSYRDKKGKYQRQRGVTPPRL